MPEKPKVKSVKGKRQVNKFPDLKSTKLTAQEAFRLIFNAGLTTSNLQALYNASSAEAERSQRASTEAFRQQVSRNKFAPEIQSGTSKTPYQEWLSTPPEKPSAAVKKVESMLPGYASSMGVDPRFDTWFGRESETGRILTYSPIRMVDRVARELATQRISPYKLAKNLVNLYPRVTKDQFIDGEKQTVTTTQRFSPLALDVRTKPNIRTVINYVRQALDEDILDDQKSFYEPIKGTIGKNVSPRPPIRTPGKMIDV